MIAVVSCSCVLNLALWIPAANNGTLMTYSALIGLLFNAFATLIPAMVGQISDIREIGTRIGTTFFLTSPATLTGNPIAGALIALEENQYKYLQIFSGIATAVGAFFFLAAKVALTRTLAAKA